MMQTRLQLFFLLLCFYASYGGEVNLMPLLGYGAPQPTPNLNNRTSGGTQAPSSAGLSNVRRLVDRHLKTSDNFTLNVQFVLPDCPKTVSRFQLYRTHPQELRRVIVGVEIYPYKHQIAVKFRVGKKARVETFYFDLTSGVTSELSVTFVDDQLLLYVNCTRIYSRRVGEVDRLVADAGEYEAIFRSKGKCSAKLQAAYLLFNSDFVEVLPKCVYATCTVGGLDPKQLKQDLLEAEEELRELSDQVNSLSRSLTKWEGCECARTCRVGDMTISNGSVWRKGPQDCQCVNGEIICICRRLICEANQSPYLAPGQPCSTCKNDCIQSGKVYKHGTSAVFSHQNCTCMSGNFDDCVSVTPINPGQGEPDPPGGFDVTPSPPPDGCGNCCSGSGCRDQAGYCVCDCSGKKCKRCGSDKKVVHPNTGKCDINVEIKFRDIQNYNHLLLTLFKELNG